MQTITIIGDNISQKAIEAFKAMAQAMKSQVKFQKFQASQRTGTDQFLIKNHQQARHFSS